MPNRPTADRAGVTPERRDDFAHLSLDGLRAYRSNLMDEESRVSYWRRIIQARLDLVRAEESGAGTAVADLRSVFAEQRYSSGRTALLRVVVADGMPPLPDLATLWERDPVRGDTAHNVELAHALTRAERQLSAYRAALHRRLATATSELIARYREEPALAASALPIG